MTKSLRSMSSWLQQWWVWFAAIFILTFISFWPSFFSAIVNIETHIIIHGISAISWMLLAVVQAWLIKNRWRKHHRTLGYASLVLAVILVLSGLRVLQTMLLKDNSVDGSNPLLAIKFLYADITALFLFCTFLWLAIKAARQGDFSLHMRLMACTAIIPLEAALERTYIYGTPSLVPNFNVAFYTSVITLIVLMATLVVIERWRKRSRWPYAALLVYYVSMLLTVDIIVQTEWFNSFAIFYANL
ncbi:DUF2306 domain-containing protein [Mangrovibacterium lignilyticum]|uniref:hypothetical protein n=1 Tax=Mangrovibacterium lignilyticum TaxID=2668052 RepID=UPI0013D01F13|nr:hypothetical protein [Mangrovibacterium lignilyticum]